jgi:hypothetical protein
MILRPDWAKLVNEAPSPTLDADTEVGRGLLRPVEDEKPPSSRIQAVEALYLRRSYREAHDR